MQHRQLDWVKNFLVREVRRAFPDSAPNRLALRFTYALTILFDQTPSRIDESKEEIEKLKLEVSGIADEGAYNDIMVNYINEVCNCILRILNKDYQELYSPEWFANLSVEKQTNFINLIDFCSLSFLERFKDDIIEIIGPTPGKFTGASKRKLKAKSTAIEEEKTPEENNAPDSTITSATRVRILLPEEVTSKSRI